jgi:antirestriction protein ArdC
MSFRHTGRETADRRDPIQEFADRIVAELEKGIKPWVRPWDPDKCAGPQAPINSVTNANYHGINVLILTMHPLALMSGDPRWMTYQQALEKGWQVENGERSTTIFFTKKYQVEDEEAEDGEKAIRVLNIYAVFHASQVEGVSAYPGNEEGSVQPTTVTTPGETERQNAERMRLEEERKHHEEIGS